ncbi:MAG: TonB-dependent receptor [Dysgonamonadaceae bacterium]|nr:TonB-dependent receptor [Dysgonamonadaceae bacterium]
MKKHRKIAILLLMALWVNVFVCAQMNAQSRMVSGVVTDTSGETVIGASVTIKGTQTGTATDVDGKYSLSVPNENKTLVISYIGMKTKEVAITGNVVDVTLEEDVSILDEVVVIGYGTMKKRDLTGAVSSISGDKLREIPVSSPAEAITGKIAGVQITTTEGSPDAEIKIRIRGGGSITQDNSPLYIVDGFPVNSINDIASSDIATLDVLKDASSAAIYGSRGANGVIIITTKSGVGGKPKIEYNGYVGFKNITGYLDTMNPYEYVLWQYEYAGSSPKDLSRLYGNFSDIDLYKQMQGTNWQQQVFGQTGTQMNHNLSVNGGNETIKYNFSLSRMDDTGIMIEQGFSKTNMAFKLNAELTKTLNLDVNFRLADTQIKGAGTSTATSGSASNSRLKHAVSYKPVNGLSSYIDDSDFNDDSDSRSLLNNPVQVTKDDYKKESRRNFTYNMGLNWKIVDNLVYRGEVGVTYGLKETDHFYGTSTSQSINNGGKRPIVNIANNSELELRLANTLTYSLTNINDLHNLTLLLGNEVISNQDKSITSESNNFAEFIDAETALAMMASGSPNTINTSVSPDERLASFFGRVNYNYKGKYLFSATVRADGSSKFTSGNRWGTFPSVSGAWRISDEEFMTISQDWLSNLKIRASFGMAGNNRIPSNASSLVFRTQSKKESPYLNEVRQPYLTVSSMLSNPDLKWEITTTRNIGVDFGLFKNRLNVTIDAYYNTTSDLLIQATIPANTGYTQQWQNIGKTSNRGIEITLDGILIDKKDFQLSASFNIGFNKNRIEELGDIKSFTQNSGWMTTDGPGDDYLVAVGKPVGLMYGYITDGMYSFDDFDYNPTTGKYEIHTDVPSDETILSSRNYFGPGTLKLKDISGPNGKPDGEINHYDQTVIGNANPKNTGGFNLSAQYKGFDLSAAFNWVYGNDIYNANKIDFTSAISSRSYRNLLDIANSSNRFTVIDPNTGEMLTDPEALQTLNQGKTMWSTLITKGVFHSWAVEDGSFLRLNTLTLGYAFPNHLTQKIRVNRLRIYATAYNVWTWTNYSGYDPEVDTRRSTPMTPGVDYSAYPRSRSFNFGINLTF